MSRNPGKNLGKVGWSSALRSLPPPDFRSRDAHGHWWCQWRCIVLVDSDLSGDVARVLAGLMLLFGPDFFLPDFFFCPIFCSIFWPGFFAYFSAPFFLPRFFGRFFGPGFRCGGSLRPCTAQKTMNAVVARKKPGGDSNSRKFLAARNSRKMFYRGAGRRSTRRGRCRECKRPGPREEGPDLAAVTSTSGRYLEAL